MFSSNTEQPGVPLSVCEYVCAICTEESALIKVT